MDVVLSRKEVSIEGIDEKTEGGTHWVIPVVFYGMKGRIKSRVIPKK